MGVLKKLNPFWRACRSLRDKALGVEGLADVKLSSIFAFMADMAEWAKNLPADELLKLNLLLKKHFGVTL